MTNLRAEILKALPIPDFLIWWHDNWPGTGFYAWADELLEMEKEVAKQLSSRDNCE